MTDPKPMTRLEMSRRELEPGERARMLAALQEGVSADAVSKRFSWSVGRVKKLAREQRIKLQIGRGRGL